MILKLRGPQAIGRCREFRALDNPLIDIAFLPTPAPLVSLGHPLGPRSALCAQKFSFYHTAAERQYLPA